MVEGVGVSDEQLEQWAEAIGDALTPMRGVWAARDGLVGEVRASHAREAEQRAATILANKVWAEAAAERDELQQRIDKVLAITYASDDGSEHEHNKGCQGEPTCPACWVTDVRAALTGTGDTE